MVLGVDGCGAGPLAAAGRVMQLYVEPMDAVVVDVAADGRVRLENEDWSVPTLQERRAIIYAATNEIAALTELLEILDPRQRDRQDTKVTSAIGLHSSLMQLAEQSRADHRRQAHRRVVAGQLAARGVDVGSRLCAVA